MCNVIAERPLRSAERATVRRREGAAATIGRRQAQHGFAHASGGGDIDLELEGGDAGLFEEGKKLVSAVGFLVERIGGKRLKSGPSSCGVRA